MTFDLTERVAAATRDALAARAHATRNGHDGTWRNVDIRDQFLRVIANIDVTTGEGTVTAVAPRIVNGDYWAYVAGEALQAARPGARVTRTDRYTFTLTLD